METIKELLNARFTHLSAAIDAQGTLIDVKLDEVITHQKTANSRTSKIEEKCEDYDEYLILDHAQTPLWKKFPLYVLVSILFTIVGLGIRTFIDVAELKNHTISDTTYINAQASLIMHVEAKTRAMESLAKTNAADIIHVTQYIKEMKTAQDSIDQFLYAYFRVRGPEEMLPEF